MRVFFAFLVIFLLCSCSCKKGIEAITRENTVLESDCPSDGICSVEIIKDKSIIVKTDETGQIYTQFADSRDTSVLVWRYDRDNLEGFQDGSHREEIILEIKNTDTNLVLTDEELQQRKVIFGRFCFCKGQSGYYKIVNGKLNMKKLKDILTLELNFKISEVPQVINKINASVK